MIKRVIIIKLVSESYQAPASLTEGSKVKGTIKSVTEFGITLDVAGWQGLMSVSDIAWWGGGSPDLKTFFKEGDELEALVLAADESFHKVSLGIKQLVLYPWKKVAKKYAVGTKVKGKVTRFTNYGAVVMLEPWVEGIVLEEEISWTKRRSPNVALKINEELDAVVIKVNDESNSIHLSARQPKPNPWGEIEKRFPVGSTVKATVRHVFGDSAYLDIDNGIDGIITVPGKSWSRPAPAHEIMKNGDTIEAEVKFIEKENSRIRLSLKNTCQSN